MFASSLNPTQPRLDRVQLAALAALMLIGVAFIYSATMVREPLGLWAQYQDSTFVQFLQWLAGRYFFRQIIWYALGTGAAIAICLVDYRVLARWSLVVYWAAIIPLVAVLVPGIGSTHGWGAQRWIDLGPFQMQPSEFAKLGVLLALAHFLSRPADELRQPLVFSKTIGLLLLPFALILKEPDLGSALVLLPTALSMMFVAGTPRRYLLRLVGGTGVVVALLLVDILFAPLAWQPVKLKGYQRDRLLVYFGRDFAPANASPAQRRAARELQEERTYQVKQALISVGSGGVGGKGWRRGQQIALGFLPPGASHNDFIFSVIAEEKGFVGSVVVIALYSVVLFSGIRTAGQARDRLGKILAVGVVTLLFSQVFINIGMNIRIMPVTGVPLPLLSYGGSSVLGSLIAMGILQNIYIHRKG